MRISTRSRYGLRLMIYLASNPNKGYILLKDVAKKEDISEKYLSLIAMPLRRGGLLTASRGLNGGYAIAKNPSKITAREIIETLEGDLNLIDCVADSDYCGRKNDCTGRYLWQKLSEHIRSFLESITLEDLVMLKERNEIEFINYAI